MTKSERNKLINKLVYMMAEKLGYEVDMTDVDVEFISPSGNPDDNISYRRSTQDVCDLNWSSERTKLDVWVLETYIKLLNGKDDNQLDVELEFSKSQLV